jgi:hypothetical protein
MLASTSMLLLLHSLPAPSAQTAHAGNCWQCRWEERMCRLLATAYATLSVKQYNDNRKGRLLILLAQLQL